MTDFIEGDYRALIGGDNANNRASTSSVVRNRDGSILERLEDLLDLQAQTTVSSTAILADATTIFTVAGGPIFIEELLSLCITACDGTASTLQWSADGTVGAATTFTGASASLASFAAGGMVVCNFTAVSTAPDLITAGVGLASVKTRGIIVPAGIITTTVAVGSTTGTFSHHMRWRPLARGVTVS
jgi:hypothetical protein